MKMIKHVLWMGVAVIALTAPNSWADFSNTAHSNYRDSLSNVYISTSNTVQVGVVTPPQIALVKSANPTSVVAGGTVTFMITYTNNGGAASNVSITDAIPA